MSFSTFLILFFILVIWTLLGMLSMFLAGAMWGRSSAIVSLSKKILRFPAVCFIMLLKVVF